mmetsp:Transcript_6180/g.26257  ORF Transcript_6180/g.26257 Transcript_6180/m.26257 type:complete len:302 (-) Transcript_6180:84-989(-)
MSSSAVASAKEASRRSSDPPNHAHSRRAESRHDISACAVSRKEVEERARRCFPRVTSASSPTYTRASVAAAGAGATTKTPAALAYASVASKNAGGPQNAPPSTSRAASYARFGALVESVFVRSVVPFFSSAPVARRASFAAPLASAGIRTVPSETPELRWYAETAEPIGVESCDFLSSAYESSVSGGSPSRFFSSNASSPARRVSADPPKRHARYRNGPCATSAFETGHDLAGFAKSSANPRRRPTCRTECSFFFLELFSRAAAEAEASRASSVPEPNERSPGDKHSTFPRSVTASSSRDG